MFRRPGPFCGAIDKYGLVRLFSGRWPLFDQCLLHVKDKLSLARAKIQKVQTKEAATTIEEIADCAITETGPRINRTIAEEREKRDCRAARAAKLEF